MKIHIFGKDYHERTRNRIEQLLDRVRAQVEARCAYIQELVRDAKDRGELSGNQPEEQLEQDSSLSEI